MPKFARMVRSSLPFAGLIFLCLLTISQKSSAVTTTTTTYFFQGTCTDCTGTGNGNLILQNYTLGTPITANNFITFSYQSNLTGFTISQGSLQSISGTLPTSLPAPANITIAGSLNAIASQVNGNWCAGLNCLADVGTGSFWYLTLPGPGTPSTVPALSVPVLIGLALTLALMGGILLKRLPKKTGDDFGV